MALSPRKSKRKAKRTKRSEERMRRLAPLEKEGAVAARADNGDADEGILRTSLDRMPLASDFVEAESNAPWWQPGPVLLVVLGLVFLFMVFITWEITARSRWVEGEGWRIEMSREP